MALSMPITPSSVLRFAHRMLFILLCVVAGPLPAAAQAVTARNGMVVAQEARAARIGVEVLEQGGNAVDAAVATAFAMAVTYPRAGNIGGGGYMVIHLAEGRRDIAIDYRETAPAATTRDIFLDEKGNADPAQIARLGARHRRARHGGGAGAGASALRLGPADARATDRAGDKARARRHPDRGRRRRFAAGRAAPRGPLAVLGQNLPQAGRQRARPRRHLAAARSRRHAGGDRP